MTEKQDNHDGYLDIIHLLNKEIDELKTTLLDLTVQTFSPHGEYCYSGGIKEYANAIRLLSQYGLFELTNDDGDYVVGRVLEE